MIADHSTPDALLRDAHARLLSADSITPELAGSMRYARQVAEGLVLARAHETAVLHSFYGDSHVVGSQALFPSAAVHRVTGGPSASREAPCD